MGWLADRYGRKRFIVGGLCVLAPALIWTGLARGLFGLIASRALQGLCSASIVAPLYALAGDKSPKGQRGRQMATVTMGFTAGIALGPLFSGWLAGQSILFPFGVAAAGSVAVALAIGLFVTEESVDVISAAP